MKRRGWRLIARNLWTPLGEIDILAEEPGGRLAVVEVRGVTGVRLPSRHLTASKRRRLSRLGRWAAARYGRATALWLVEVTGEGIREYSLD